MKQKFEEEIIEKPDYRTELECKSCFTKFMGNFWQKRCPNCKREDAPIKKKIVNGKQVWEGRTYKSPKTGLEYPSVTSILHPDGIDYPEFLLKQYASRGTIVHDQLEEYFVNGGTWKEPEDIPHLKDHVDIVRKGSLKLSWNDCDPLGFFKEYGHNMVFEKFEGTVINDDYQFGGRYDVIGTYKGEDALFDYKTASDYSDEKVNSYFMQLSAYAQSFPHIKYLVIIPLSPKKGYLAPYVSSNIDKHFEDYMVLRNKFREIYGI